MLSIGGTETMNIFLKERIVEKLDEVPDTRLPEVMDFLEFLTWKTQQTQIFRVKSTTPTDALRALRGRGREEQLVKRLLRARQIENGASSFCR